MVRRKKSQPPFTQIKHKLIYTMKPSSNIKITSQQINIIDGRNMGNIVFGYKKLKFKSNKYLKYKKVVK